MLTRAQWGARDPNAKPALISIKSRSGFCTHYDGSTPIYLKTLADVIAQVRKDQNFHMDGRGWNDIGYNFLVISAPGYDAIDGLIVEGRGRDVIGAHCEGHNTAWIGVQVAIGGDQQPSPKALTSVRSLYDSASAAHGGPLSKYGHRDGYSTECPGAHLYAWVKAGMPAVTKEWDEMATKDEIAGVVAAAMAGVPQSVWLHGYDPKTNTGTSAWTLLAGANAQVATLSAAVKALSEAQGADGAAITTAVVDKINGLQLDVVVK